MIKLTGLVFFQISEKDVGEYIGNRVHEKEITLGYKLIKREDVRVKEKGGGAGR
jgi:hypothetical protein